MSTLGQSWQKSLAHARQSRPMAPGRPVRFAAHRQPLYCNFMYHSRIVLSIGGSVWYMVRNLRCTVTTDSVLANSKTQNAFLTAVHAMFCHDCPLAAKPANTPRRLLPKQTWTDSLPTDMLPSAVCILVLAQPSSEFPEGIINYPVYVQIAVHCNIVLQQRNKIKQGISLHKYT